MVCLSLTCKDAYPLFESCRRSLLSQGKETLLQLLEKKPSIGYRFYYCHQCIKLHPFSVPKMAWAPNGHKLVRRSHAVRVSSLQIGESPLRLFPRSSRHELSLYGPPYGLPLDILIIDHPISELQGLLDQFTTTKIIDGVMFLAFTQSSTQRRQMYFQRSFGSYFATTSVTCANMSIYTELRRTMRLLMSPRLRGLSMSRLRFRIRNMSGAAFARITSGTLRPSSIEKGDAMRRASSSAQSPSCRIISSVVAVCKGIRQSLAYLAGLNLECTGET